MPLSLLGLLGDGSGHQRGAREKLYDPLEDVGIKVLTDVAVRYRVVTPADNHVTVGMDSDELCLGQVEGIGLVTARGFAVRGSRRGLMAADEWCAMLTSSRSLSHPGRQLLVGLSDVGELLPPRGNCV